LWVKLGGLSLSRKGYFNFGGPAMDGKTFALKEKLERLMREAAEAAADLQAAERGSPGPVHFSQIEAAAVAVGQRLSCGIQERVTREAAVQTPTTVACPTCQRECKVRYDKRTVKSTAGPVEVLEPHAHCRPCRRSFFPSA
jgi:hypothetical protein